MVCVSISLGFLLLGGGIYLTWWNEANLVCTSGAYDKASAETTSIETCSIDSDLFGQFTHLTCPVEDSLVTSESSTGIAASGAYKLTLETEQYGYEKTSESQKNGRTCDKNGNCRDTTESCSCLRTTWTTSPITQGSSSIKYCNKCPSTQYSLPPADSVWGSNPTNKLGFETKYADRVPLGDGTLQIDGSDISSIKNEQLLTAPTTPTTIDSTNDYSLVASEHCGESGTKLMCFKSLTKRYTTGVNSGVNTTDITATVIGDLRLIVKAYGSTTISAIGKQTPNSDSSVASIKSDSFGETKVPPCKASDVFYVSDGTKSASEIYQELHDGLKTLTTVLRVVSFVIIFAGFYSIFSPIQDGADMIPCIGDCLAAIVGFVLYIISALLALSVWFTVFAVAWVFYRPMLGAIFLGIAGLFTFLAFGLYRRQVAKKRQERSVEYPEAAVMDDRYGDHEKGYY